LIPDTPAHEGDERDGAKVQGLAVIAEGRPVTQMARDWNVVRQTVRAAQHVGARKNSLPRMPAVEEAEATRLLSDPGASADTRIQAARALGRPGVSDSAFDALAHVVVDDSMLLDLRMAAARSIGQMGRRARGIDFLIARFDYPLPLRRETVASLRQLGRVHPVSENALLSALERVEQEADSLMLSNLGHEGHDQRIVDACIKASRDPRPQVRRRAIGVLGMIGEFGPVIEALTDDNQELRAFAASLLGTHGVGDPAQVEALKQALTDPDPEVRRSALQSLRLLGVIDRAQPPEHSAIRVELIDARFDWPELLEKFSHAFVRDRWYQLELPDEVVESGWLGYPGAEESAIAAAEERLGLTLPPSYRSFLRTSDGFRRAGVRDICPVHQIDRVKTMWPDRDWSQEPDIADAKYFVYGPDQDPVNVRFSYLPECIAVSEYIEGDMYVLNPAVRFGDEWEAWLLSSPLPGANRYRSFWELMVDEFKTQAPKF
jgi:hypothetical protein